MNQYFELGETFMNVVELTNVYGKPIDELVLNQIYKM
jgi:hypothetical protein